MEKYKKFIIYGFAIFSLPFLSCSNDNFTNDLALDSNINIIYLDKIESEEKKRLIQKRFESCNSNRTVVYYNRTAASCIQSARNFRLSYKNIQGTYESEGGVCTLRLSNDPNLDASCYVEYEPDN